MGAWDWSGRDAGRRAVRLPSLVELRKILALCFGEREVQVHHGAGADLVAVELEALTL